MVSNSMIIPMSIDTHPLQQKRHQVAKRTVDVCVSLLVLILIFPLAYLIIGGLIKWKMPGKILFKQQRTGKEGHPFVCYKFRSMLPSNEADTMQAHDDDPRITPLGRFLRITSLDEIPQFWNVLRGEMSIVGPRPHMLLHTEYYSRLIPSYEQRLAIKPGITGWAQIHNLRGETHNSEKMRQRVEHDVWYIRHWTMGLDLRIMFRTIRVMFN